MRKAFLEMLSDRRGTDDDYFYLIFDEENGEIFVEHSWHYWKPNGPKQGSEKWSLAELKRKKPEVYKKAAALILAGFPAAEHQDSMIYPLAGSN